MCKCTKAYLKAAFFCVLFLLNGLSFSQMIQNDVFWKDTDGNPMYVQRGGTLKIGDTWYMYGSIYGSATTYYNTWTGSNARSPGGSTSCYTSKDLVNWKFEGSVFSYGGWFCGPNVAYNKNSKKYVLIAQANNDVVFATADKPTGPFKLHHVETPSPIANDGTGDATTFIDDDGTPYIICSSMSGRSHIYVVPLRQSDYLACERPVEIFKGYGREGNCMFKYKGRYYAASSDLHGWNTSHTYYISSENILGPYNKEAIMINSGLDYSHVTQAGFFITVNGTEDTTVIYCGDRWSNNAGNGIGYNQWVPITVNGTTCIFNSLSQWSIDAVKGTWKMGPKNNHILNPSFEADRILVGSVVGWEGNDANAKGSQGAGKFCLSLGSGAKATQRIPENATIANIPAGTYELKAWVQCSGGGNGQISISDFGGSEMKKSSNAGSWTEVRISNIKISTGKAIVSASNTGGGTCLMDNFSLIKVSSDTLYSILTTAAPGGIIEQSPKGDSLVKGSNVTFTAVPLSGWAFAGWSGDNSGTNPSYSISSLSANINLNAAFKFTSLDSSHYEGENTVMINSIPESTNSGFSGTGYANFNNEIGSSVEFAVCVSNDGEKNIRITFANGSSNVRPVSVSVNGSVVINTLDFYPTGSWTTWNTENISFQLHKGINTIRFTSLSPDGGPNLDKIQFESAVSTMISNPRVTPDVVFNSANYSIQANSPGKAVEVKLFTMNGKLIFYRNLAGTDKFRFPIEKIGNGHYLLKISAGSKSRAQIVHLVK